MLPLVKSWRRRKNVLISFANVFISPTRGTFFSPCRPRNAPVYLAGAGNTRNSGETPVNPVYPWHGEHIDTFVLAPLAGATRWRGEHWSSSFPRGKGRGLSRWRGEHRTNKGAETPFYSGLSSLARGTQAVRIFSRKLKRGKLIRWRGGTRPVKGRSGCNLPGDLAGAGNTVQRWAIASSRYSGLSSLARGTIR